MEIRTLKQLQDFLKENWENINNNEFATIIENALGCHPAFRRNNVEDEIAYMNEWVKEERNVLYGSDLNKGFNIKDVFRPDNTELKDRTNCLFISFN
jgi:hypothetical protein